MARKKKPASTDDDDGYGKRGAGYRERQRKTMDERRAKERDIRAECIEAAAGRDTARRRACLDDPLLFLRTYWPERYYHDWTPTQVEMAAAIVHAARHGGDQAIAAPRGEGKTALTEGLVLWCIVAGLIRFPLIVAQTGPHANQVLENVKGLVESDGPFTNDFWWISAPVRAMEGANQRANSQTFGGKRTRSKWGVDHVVLPTISGPRKPLPGCGSIIKTRGLDGSMRGVRVGGTRPDVVIIDDPDTEESAESELQTAKRERTIERAIGGMAGPGRRLARVMLCTIQNRRCISYRYTDPTQKPAWNGARYRLLSKEPTAADLWADYVTLRESDRVMAQEFYQRNRDAMDAGGEVTNPHRLIAEADPPELSAIQHCYNIIADKGRDVFDTEYQNDPPEEEAFEETGITASRVQFAFSGFKRGIVPDDTVALTAGLDIGKRYCHWAVIATAMGARARVIDYGVTEVYQAENAGDSDAAKESEVRAIYNAMHTFRDDLNRVEYATESGESKRVDLVLVDSGNWSDAVYRFCIETGQRQFRPSKGFGSRRGQSIFRCPAKTTEAAVVGDNWYASLQQSSGVWLMVLNADHWKRQVHDRFLTPQDRSPSLSVFGGDLSIDRYADSNRADARVHTSYAKHITAEIEREEFVTGKGVKRYWDQVNANNHWLDATAMAVAASSVVGVSVFGATPQQAEQMDKQRKEAIDAKRGTVQRSPGNWVTGYRRFG